MNLHVISPGRFSPSRSFTLRPAYPTYTHTTLSSKPLVHRLRPSIQTFATLRLVQLLLSFYLSVFSLRSNEKKKAFEIFERREKNKQKCCQAWDRFSRKEKNRIVFHRFLFPPIRALITWKRDAMPRLGWDGRSKRRERKKSKGEGERESAGANRETRREMKREDRSLVGENKKVQAAFFNVAQEGT